MTDKMASFWNEMDTMQIHIDQDAYECQICDNIFTSPIQLTVHCIVLHGLLPCTHCLKLFENEHLLNEHARRNHDDIKHSCTDCAVIEFSNEVNFHAHISHAHSKKHCQLCGLLVLDADYQYHFENLHKVTKELTTIRLIIAADIQNQFHCHLCADNNKTVNRLDKLFFHYLYFHKCSLQSLLRCILRENEVKTLRSMQSNYDDPLAKCSNCSFDYSCFAPKIYHKIYCQGFVYCASCSNCFDNQEKYEEHIRNCIQATIEAGFCDNCNIKNVSGDELHLKTVHKISKVTQRTHISSLLNTQNDCNFCEINLSSDAAKLDELIKHFRTLHQFNATTILGYLKKSNVDIKLETVQK